MLCLVGLLGWSCHVFSQTPGTQSNPASGLQQPKSYEYRNSKYGFIFLLPAGWRGCRVVEDTWDGYTITDHGDQVVERGPEIRIVNPRSKVSDQYQDISIMVFTRKQWEAVQQEKFFVSAAPTGPGELGRNARYVFAVLPRMINPDLEGADEIISIMQSKPLHAF